MDYDIKKFTTRYLGSKAKLLDWIWEETNPILEALNIDSIVDAFAGTSIVSYMYKQKGFNIISNDFLLFNYYKAKALIENNVIKLSNEEIKFLCNPPKSSVHFIEEEYTDVFFPREDTEFLDNLYFAILTLDNEYKQAIAFCAIAETILKRVSYGRFTTTKMSSLGKRTMKDYFSELIIHFNDCVFDNKKENKAYMCNASDLLKETNAKAAYFDPPYGGKSFSKYEHYYNFVEVYINYWKDEVKVGKLKQVKKKESVFSYGKKHNDAFIELLNNSVHIPLWIFSYNDNAGLPIDKLKEIISKYKSNIEIKEKEYEYANKVAQYKEYLIIAY